jgi:ribosomal protein S18 acetylase RimI-like enzyme
MQNHHFSFRKSDLLDMRSLLQQPSNELANADFDEYMALESTGVNTRIWRNHEGLLIAFAFVDGFNNLCFAVDEKYNSRTLELELVEWGMTCMRRRNIERDELATLDASCRANNRTRLAFLERYGFNREKVRTYHYERNLLAAIPRTELPEGFLLCSVNGEEQAERLAALHRSAFGTDQMSLEYRLAMMRVPNYDPRLGLFIMAPSGEPVAFCVCSVAVEENERDGSKNGYTDPIGVEPRFQDRSLGKAILTAGLQALKTRGMEVAKLSTSSENIPMQRLAEALGFRVVSEKIWFSKVVV